MGPLKKLLTYALAFVVMIVGLLISLGNATPVSLSILTWETPTFPVFAWLLLFFLVGVGVGLLLSLNRYLRDRAEVRRLQREITNQRRSNPLN